VKARDSSRKGNPRKKVTIEDVAEHLGVSKATVSLALNDSPLVAEKTKARVKEAARKLNYRANFFASRLSQGTSATIGLFVLGGEAESIWTLPSSWMFYHPIMQGVVHELSAEGYRLMFEVVRTEEAMEGKVLSKAVQEGFLDGIILLVQEDISYDFVEIATEMEFPLVVLNARIPADVSSVKIDNEAGAKKVIAHLMELGHERIAYIGGPVKDLNALERYKGVMRGAREAGLPLRDEYLKVGNWRIESGEQFAKELMELDEPPTAIFCANDQMAVGAILSLQALGYDVPGDVSVAGYDNSEICSIINPHITSVQQSLEVMGEIGAQEVLRLIRNGVSLARHTKLEPELVVRESTAPCREKQAR